MVSVWVPSSCPGVLSQQPIFPEQVEAGGFPPQSPQGLRPHSQDLAQAERHPSTTSGRPNGRTCPLPGQADGLLQVQEVVLGVLPPLTAHPHCCGRQGSGSSAFIVPGAEAVRDGTSWQLEERVPPGPRSCQEEGPRQAACVGTWCHLPQCTWSQSGTHSRLQGAAEDSTHHGLQELALGPSLLQTLTDRQGGGHFWAC